MSDFDFDPAAARSADNTGRISENGGYKGEIIAAWKDFSTKGSQSFNIKFKTDEGQNVNLVFWVKNKDGEKLAGEKLVHKIMACVGVRPLNSRPGTVSIYSYQDKQEVKHDKEVYPELVGKKIGLFLERENELYTSNGQDKEGFKMQVFAPFRYEDHKMAAEIMDKAPKAQQYEKVLAWIIAKKPRVNDRREQRANEYPDDSGVYGGRHSSADNGVDDDDIPF